MDRINGGVCEEGKMGCCGWEWDVFCWFWDGMGWTRDVGEYEVGQMSKQNSQ